MMENLVEGDNLTEFNNLTSFDFDFDGNMTDLNNLEDILGNFKQTLISNVELSFSVFYSLVSFNFRTFEK
jgi:hypothetical protein